MRIVIMAKAPLAGVAKTRLIPALGAQGAARLARTMLEETIAAALAARLGPVELCGAPAPVHPDWRGVALPAALQLTAQGEGDLGQRLARVAQRVIGDGQALLLIGTDCPAMTAERLIDCAAALCHAAGVMLPTFDGGYALLGLTRFDPSLFSGIAWSSATVAADTRRRFAALGWPLQSGAAVHDIDLPDDLAHVPPGWLGRQAGARTML